MIGIYQIKNKINNKRYIGQSINITKRIWTHKNNLLKNIHTNRYLQSAFNKYGINNFEFTLLIICLEKDLDFYEELIVNGYKSNDTAYGYNLRTVQSSNKNTILKYKVGDVFNGVTLLKPLNERSSDKNRKWLCSCHCGKIWAVVVYAVKSGSTKSCGCLNDQMRSKLMKLRHNNPEWKKLQKERSKKNMIENQVWKFCKKNIIYNEGRRR